MLLKTIVTLAALLAGFCIYAATRPNNFRYTRSLAIGAAPETLFPYINDVHKFQEWNPFVKEDPNNQITYSGPDAGLDAACDWSGGKSGEGSMTIVESKPAELVRYRMDFRKPFAATHTAEFTLKPEGGETVVSWSLYGDNNFIGKAMSVFIDCDKMCGEQFLKGLASLKSLIEKTGGQPDLPAGQ